MLNGVGGCSVAEAKERISHEESLKWQAFLEKHGTIHTGRRLETGFALLAWIVDRKLGGKSQIRDFMPHFQEPEATLEDVMKTLVGSMGAKKGG